MSKLLAKKMTLDKKLSFQEFFSSEEDNTISPFLTSRSKKWGKNLSLRAAIFSGVLLAVAFVLSFFQQWLFLSLILQVFVYFIAGTPALIEAVKELADFKVNIDVLMVLAAFMSIFIDSSLEGGLLLVLFSISSAMEDFVTTKAKSTLNHLNEMSPTIAHVMTLEGKVKQRSVKDVQVGEHILVRAGDIIPLDGKIIEGKSSVNVAHLTGEHIPLNVEEGQEVVSGAVNVEGSLKLEVTKTGSQSTISKIIQLICDAHEARPKLQSWFDRFGQRYSIFVILTSAFFALFLPLFFKNMPYLTAEGSVYRALAYLIAASPCALIIAVPIAYISAINASAKQGIILKGGITLDTLSQIQAMAFDKTGTLTSGKLECLKLTDHEGKEVTSSLPTLLSVAYGLEQHAIHPVAEAIISFAKKHNIEPAQVADCRALPGLGIEGNALIDGQSQPVAIGSLAFISSKLETQPQSAFIQELTQHQHLLTGMLLKGKLYVFQFIDHLKHEATEVLSNLKSELNLELYVLSGDHQQSVERVAKHLPVDHYYAALKPEDKLQLVEKLSKDKKLAMVGDGVNDGPALARSSIGIAMGSVGSHMANQVAEVVIINDDLSLIQKAIYKAKQTLRIVKQNVLLASCVILGISIPALFGWIPLWLAVVCHEGGTVLVGLNSLRLLKNR